MAAARSVLLVERDPVDSDIRIVRQVKNSLAPTGPDLYFEIRNETGFRWLSKDATVQQESKNEKAEAIQIPVESLVQDLPQLPKNKHELCAVLLRKVLANGDVESKRIRQLMRQYDIGNKTMTETKADLGITSYRKMRQWYWHMEKPSEEEVT